MAEAKSRLQQEALAVKQAKAVVCRLRLEAYRAARQEVIHKLKAQGVKVSLMSATAITKLTIQHLRSQAAQAAAEAEASGRVAKFRSDAQNGGPLIRQ
jgi:hypothetical protein